MDGAFSADKELRKVHKILIGKPEEDTIRNI
jgi:hypothetical protein